MDITVNTQDVTAANLVEVELTDASGAHVEVVLMVGDQPPLRHAFDFKTGSVIVPLPNLKRGQHSCTLIMLALKHKLSPNRMYDLAVSFNGAVAATARGKIPADRSNDSGVGDFMLTVA